MCPKIALELRAAIVAKRMNGIKQCELCTGQ